jgi:hypothetical protein
LVGFAKGILGRDGGDKASRPSVHHGDSHLKEFVKSSGHIKGTFAIVALNEVNNICTYYSPFLQSL